METWYYEIISIDGDYANLKRIDVELDDLKLVARALLPEDIEVGSKLKYELFQYEIILNKQLLNVNIIVIFYYVLKHYFTTFEKQCYIT